MLKWLKRHRARVVLANADAEALTMLFSNRAQWEARRRVTASRRSVPRSLGIGGGSPRRSREGLKKVNGGASAGLMPS
jgi:hypothetical protein